MKKVLWTGAILIAGLGPLGTGLAATNPRLQNPKTLEGAAPKSSDPGSKAQNQETASTTTGPDQSSPNGSTQKAGGSTDVAAVNPEATSRPAGRSAEAQRLYASGMAFYESQKYDEAIGTFKLLIKLKPDDSQAHYSLGMAYVKSNSYKEALDSFKHAVRFKPDWAEAHFQLGWMNYVLGKKEQSTEEYNKLLKLNSALASEIFRLTQDNKGPELQKAPESLTLSPQPGPLKKDQTGPVSAPLKEVPSSSAASLPGEAKTGPDSASASDESLLTGTYKVGVGDVIDIRLLNSTTTRSTLYTVIEGGLIDFPLAGGSVAVGGLTTDEIQARLAAELKRRAVEENSQLTVGVRQYWSHSIMVTGLVGIPGTKILRREAVPLYVVLADAQPRLDAARATIIRVDGARSTVDLTDSVALNVLVRPGDVISLTARPTEFYYIGGRINYPGQKAFQPGITLLQAILAAGGPIRQPDNAIELSREGPDGKLSTTKFNLRDIKLGKVRDPRLQPGDRIDVIR